MEMIIGTDTRLWREFEDAQKSVGNHESEQFVGHVKSFSANVQPNCPVGEKIH